MHIIRHDFENGYHDRILTRERPNSQRNRKRLRQLLLQKTGGRLLEIGCGKGGFLSLAEQHFDVEGMDISQSVINRIKPHFGSRVNVYNIEQQPLPSGEFDVVAVFNVLEHLRQPGQVVDKLFRSLANGGILFGSVPNNFGLVGGLSTRLSNFFDRTHIATFSPAAWNRIFHQAGFSKIRFFGEITIGPNVSQYCQGRLWPYLSFNLMFLCSKA
jgi:2-polyprenyl-3-methyl-5-hydroxy-6-metoxy-1,4-benzoquinol methylase